MTNNCDMDVLFDSVVTDKHITRVYSFTNQDVMELIEKAGNEKTERGGRVSPIG